MSLPRFHLPAAAWCSPHLTLTNDEAQHCGRVMRKQPGDEIEIFDGAGRVAVCEIVQVSKAEVQAKIVSESRVDPFQTAIHLLPALIKAEPFEWLLEKAVELGAASILPIVTERTIVHLGGDHLEKKMTRWQRHMIESAKQCHTPFITRLEKPQPLPQAIADLPSSSLKIIPALSEHSRTLHQVSGGLPSPTDAYLLIGPEGDFTPSEETLAQELGFIPVTLGPLILRAETAAISTLAVLRHELLRPVGNQT